ncbi:hypothetical protein NBRC116590_20950 [Pelagimonas sp. KU-00592-HH]
MAHALQAQADIFRDEQRQRQETEAKDYLEKLLDGLVSSFVWVSLPYEVSWLVRRNKPEGEIQEFYVKIEGHGDDRNSCIQRFTRSVTFAWAIFVAENEEQEVVRTTKFLAQRMRISRFLTEIDELMPSLSRAEKIVLEDLGLLHTKHEWLDLLDCEEIWDEES